MELFYRPHVGFEGGRFLRKFGQWYVTVLFLLAVSVLLIDLGTSIRSAIGGEG